MGQGLVLCEGGIKGDLGLFHDKFLADDVIQRRWYRR
jgi:hypothetical protein